MEVTADTHCCSMYCWQVLFLSGTHRNTLVSPYFHVHCQSDSRSTAPPSANTTNQHYKTNDGTLIWYLCGSLFWSLSACPKTLILYLLHVIKPLHLTHPPTCTMQLLNCFKSVSTSPLEVRHTPTPLLIMCTASALPIRYLTSALTLKDLQLVNREWFSLTSHPCYKHTHTHKPISESLRGFLIELHEFVLRPHRLSLWVVVWFAKGYRVTLNIGKLI